MGSPHIDTELAAYKSSCIKKAAARSIRLLIRKAAHKWKLRNSFFKETTNRYPIIKLIKKRRHSLNKIYFTLLLLPGKRLSVSKTRVSISVQKKATKRIVLKRYLFTSLMSVNMALIGFILSVANNNTFTHCSMLFRIWK